jgi:hypothetical protein
MLCSLLLCADPGWERFSEVEIEKPFDAYLRSNVLLMEVTGAKIIRLGDDRHVVLAVASTLLKDDTAKERLRAERVCRTKALASVVAERQGVQVSHVEKIEERTVVVLDGEKEKAKSVTEALQVTKSNVQGIARDMPVVGRWKSKDGDVFYLALGVVVEKNGEPVREEAPK